MGTHFASDGMVWADPESAFDMPVRGYVCVRIAYGYKILD